MKHWMTSVTALLLLTLLTGVCYPLAVNLAGRLFLNAQSGGSLVRHNGTVVGSELIGQAFSDPKYFWPRPSAVKYDAASSGATNQSLTAKELAQAVREREAQGMTNEMRFASGSGLDPHISPPAARSQVMRVAHARGLNGDQRKALELLLESKVEERQFGFMGQPRINVLKLNLAVDEQFR